MNNHELRFSLFPTFCLSQRALRETLPLKLFLTPSPPFTTGAFEYAEYTEGECFCHDLEKD
jgi:hypothetical protein